MHIKTADGSYNVASQGVAGAGLGLGIAGTALSLLNGGLGFLGFGGNMRNGYGYGCGETSLISSLFAQIGSLTAERYADGVGTGVYAEINKKYTELAQFIAKLDKDTAVAEAVNAERLSCLMARVAQIEGLTKVVIPNASICPGWGNVTVTPVTTTTTVSG